MTGFDPSRCGYVPPFGTSMVMLGRKKPGGGTPPPLAAPPTVALSAVTVGKVTTVTTSVTGDNANPAGITWTVTPAPDSNYGKRQSTGPTAVFKHTGSSATVTATVPRTDGGTPVTASFDVARSTQWKSGVFPRAYSWGEDVKVEETFGFPTARTGVTCRLVRTVSPGVASERSVIETRTVDFPAGTPVVLSRTMSFTRPAGDGAGYEFVWEVDDAEGRVIRSGPLPVWVYGTGVGPQALSAAPARIPYPGIYTRAASDSRQVTPAAGKTYADHVAQFIGQWKATNLSTPVGGAWLSLNDYNSSIYWVDLDDATIPRVTFAHYDTWEWGWDMGGWYGSDPWAKPYPRDRVALNVPMPPNATPSPGTDRSLTIVGLRGGQIERIWEFWLAEKMGNGSWRAASIGTTTAADDWRHSAGYTVAASGISAVAYSLKVSEAKSAVDYIRAERAAGRTPSEDEIARRIPHALSINMPSPRSGQISYPATFSDGDNSDPAAMWEGQLAYIRQDADINAQNYPALTHAIAVAGKRWGFRCTDKTSWSTSLVVEGDQSYGGGIWSTILTGSESWALKYPDDWWVVGRQYADRAAFDADTTRNTLTVTAVEDVPGEALVSWTPAVAATVSRDGVDTTGDGPWTDTATGSYRFRMLVPGATYTFTVAPPGQTATVATLTIASAVTTTPVPNAQGLTGYSRMVFRDEFDGTALDTTVWTPHRGLPGGAYYTPYNASIERLAFAVDRATVSGGALRLAWDKTQITTGGKTFDYTGGMAHTGKGFSFTYGFVEARISVTATTPGLWPAFWLLPTPVDRDWPPEIDIVEMITGDTPDGLYHPHFNVHWGVVPNNAQMGWKSYGPSGTNYAGSGWHTYGLEWTPSKLQVYVDGVAGPSYTDAANIPQRAMYVILNTAVQEARYGDPAPSGVVAVDYVRVWQAGAAPTQTTPASGTPYPDAGIYPDTSTYPT